MYLLSHSGVSNLLGSLGHTLNTLQHIITKKKSHNVLSKFTILCWATFTAILGHRLDAPASKLSNKCLCVQLGTVYAGFLP